MDILNLTNERFAPSMKQKKTLLYEEQSGKCYYCKLWFAKNHGNLDHKQPRALGGSDATSNLAFTCFRCNTEKGCLTESDYKAVLEARKL